MKLRIEMYGDGFACLIFCIFTLKMHVINLKDVVNLNLIYKLSYLNNENINKQKLLIYKDKKFTKKV